jgi:selenium-binding protein 1
MARWTPDPSFYPSPESAAGAPPETLAYVATLNTDSGPDALNVLDLEAGSDTYGQLVGRFDMPNVGDELHHFGWNACSSALCPWAPHPHVERRYLLVPGLRSSRIHVLDVKDDPRAPKLTKVIEPEEIAKKAGYSRPHTVHCGPDGIYVSALGNPEGDGPGGIFLLDHDDFSVKGAWEADRGPQELAYDFWWHLNHDTVITSEWGTPNMVEDGLIGELLLGNKYGHKLHVQPKNAQARAGDRPRRRAPDGARAAARPQSGEDVRVRRRRRLDRRPDGVRMAVESRRRRHRERRQGHHDPAGAGRGRPAAADPAAVRRGAAADHRHRAVGRRPGPLRLLLGHRRAQALRRVRPAQPARDRLGAPGRHRRAGGAPGQWPAERWPADGRGEPRRAPHLPTNSLYAAWDKQFYSEGINGWLVKLDAGEDGSLNLDPNVFVEFSGERPHQVRLGGGDASSDSYCFPND